MDLVLVVKKLDVEMTKDTYKTVIMTVHCLLSDVMTSDRLRQVSIWRHSASVWRSSGSSCSSSPFHDSSAAIPLFWGTTGCCCWSHLCIVVRDGTVVVVTFVAGWFSPPWSTFSSTPFSSSVHGGVFFLDDDCFHTLSEECIPRTWTQDLHLERFCKCL